MPKANLLSGTALSTERGWFYVKNGKRMVIPSRKVLNSWRFKKVVKHLEDDVSHLPVVGKLGFRDGSLLFCIADASYYIVTGNKLFKIVDPQTLKDHGLKITNAIWVSRSERDYHGRVEV